MPYDKSVSEMDSFLESFKKTAMDSIAKLNDVQWEAKSWEHEGYSDPDSLKGEYHYRHDVNSSRGKVFEKATVSEIFITYEEAAETMIKFGMADEGKPVDVRVLQIEIFPASPLLPMGHINLERFYGKKKLLFINLDIFPASTPETEIEAVRNKMAEVAKKHGRDQWKISSGLAVQYNMEG